MMGSNRIAFIRLTIASLRPFPFRKAHSSFSASISRGNEHEQHSRNQKEVAHVLVAFH
jgi:hypothetical protein